MGKANKKITNWVEYNKALCRRGSVTFWIEDSAVDAWRCKTHHGNRGSSFEITLAKFALLTFFFINTEPC